MSYETIQLEMREAVGIITLNRPASLNALTTEVGQEFQAAVAEVQQRGARAVVITGAGLREVRLRPGSSQAHVTRDGKPIPAPQELLTITRGGKQVVRRSRPAAARPSS